MRLSEWIHTGRVGFSISAPYLSLSSFLSAYFHKSPLPYGTFKYRDTEDYFIVKSVVLGFISKDTVVGSKTETTFIAISPVPDPVNRCQGLSEGVRE